MYRMLSALQSTQTILLSRGSYSTSIESPLLSVTEAYLPFISTLAPGRFSSTQRFIKSSAIVAAMIFPLSFFCPLHLHGLGTVFGCITVGQIAPVIISHPTIFLLFLSSSRKTSIDSFVVNIITLNIL